MNAALLARLRAKLAERAKAGLWRKTEARTSQDSFINLANNDYLALAHDPAVVAAAVEALKTWGASSSASPLVTGYTAIHESLEKALAAWHGYPHGLLLNTGFAANAAVLGGLPQKGDVVLADRLVHASMIAGILASGARLRRFAHNDLESLELMLHEESTVEGVIFVVTESVYSMDGDCPDLRRLADLRERFKFCWVLDEAHATGWHGLTGSGLQEEQGVRGTADVVVGTLGKALASHGAYVLSRVPEIRDALVNFSGEFIYSTYLAPSHAAAALAAVQRVQELAPVRPELHHLSRTWRQALVENGFAVPDGHSPIIPVVVGDTEVALRFSQGLREAGILVSAIRPPTVPVQTARLRISLKRGLTSGTLQQLLNVMKGISL
jgi:8-amino-7-oxononanoate synthase